MKKFILLTTIYFLLTTIIGCGGGTPAQKYGLVYVNSTPTGAEIYIDGASQNKVTPNTISNLTEGSHSLKLTKEGRKDYNTTINIVANQAITMDVTLEPLDFPPPTLKE